MLEIEEKIPYYICNQDDMSCHISDSCGKECRHTTYVGFAKHKEAVDIFNKFCDTFHVCVDGYGRLLCTEKEANK